MPYFHASIADVLDGSSFDIWVVNPNRMLIVPGAKASVPAFIRLVSYLDSKLGEGKLAEYGEADRKEG